jgi:hypothetical protein
MNANSTWWSQAVIHPSTNHSQCCLTSFFLSLLYFIVLFPQYSLMGDKEKDKLSVLSYGM